MKQIEFPVEEPGTKTSFKVFCPGCRRQQNMVYQGRVEIPTIADSYICPDPTCPGTIDIAPARGRKRVK